MEKFTSTRFEWKQEIQKQCGVVHKEQPPPQASLENGWPQTRLLQEIQCVMNTRLPQP